MSVLFLLLHVLCAWADEAGADVLTYPLGPGDELRLEVVGQPEMSGDVRIDPAGRVLVPLARGVLVGGLTLDQARAAIVADLAQGYLRNPQVVLDIKTYASRQVEVSGAVVRPATYALRAGETTVSRLLVDAGGLLDPNAAEVQIWRDRAGQREVLRVDLERLRRGDPSADLPLAPGDHVYVPIVDQVYVDGQVGKPGAIPYRDGMTLTEAITQAGSALGTAQLRGAYILRGGKRMDVNLRSIQRARTADVPLQPGDRIFIPESAF